MHIRGFDSYGWGARRLGLALLGVLWLQAGAFAATAGRLTRVLSEPRSGSDLGAVRVVEVPTPTVDRDPFRPTGNPFVDAWRVRLAETPPRLLDAYLARPAARERQLGPILDEHGVPREFLYLALVESGMDADAISPAAAVGLWQFRDATARQYGLLITDDIDERVDERRATQAAGRYLRDLYEQFGSWELAAAAYNAGPGRVRRALNATGADSYWELLEAGHLPRETRAYVPRFLAIVGLAAERERTLAPVAAD